MGCKIEKGIPRPCFHLVLNQGIVHWHNSTTYTIKKICVMHYLANNICLQIIAEIEILYLR